MKTVTETSSRHDTSCKAVYNKNLIILYNVILISVHKCMCTKSKDNCMLDLKVFRICKVLNMEELFYFLNTLCSKNNVFVLLIYKVITIFLDLSTHDSIKLTDLCRSCTFLHSSCEIIAHLIYICRLSALSRNDKRCTSLINKDRVNLIYNTEVKSSLNKAFLIDNHVVTKIIKSELVIGNICDIAVVSFSSRIIFIRIEDNSDCEAEESMNRTHPLSITLCKVIIYSNYMNTFSCKGIEVSRKCRNKCFTFTCSHFRDSSLMEKNTTHKLYPKVLHTEYTECSLSYSCKCFYKNIIKSFTF